MSAAGWPKDGVRVIMHIDMDAFFAAVEERFLPILKDQPVIVGGGPDQRGVASTANYAARKFGVHSATPLRQASRPVLASMATMMQVGFSALGVCGL